MADPHSETGGGQPLRNPGESSLPDGQASGGTKKALKPTDVFAAKKTPAPTDEAGAEGESAETEGQERFWQTDKFRTYSSIGLICLLLGTFGVVCYMKYRERLAKGDNAVATGANENEESTETGTKETENEDSAIAPKETAPEEIASDKAVPTPLADLSGEPEASPAGSAVPTPIEKPQNLDEEGIADLTPEPIDNPPANKVAATPISEGKTSADEGEDLFADEKPVATAPKAADVSPPASNPAGLTSLDAIESEEPATLGKLEEEESPGPGIGKATPSAAVETDEFAPVEKSVVEKSPVIEKSKPVPMEEPERSDELQEEMARFREFKIDSRQSSGTTKVVASEEGDTIPSSPTEKKIQDEEELFASPETTGKNPLRPQPEETAGSSASEEPAITTPSREKPTQGWGGGGSGAPDGEIYVVKARDTYWKISKMHYGSVRYFLALARHNQDQVPNPRLMRPGMKIRVPSADVLEAEFPDLFPKQKAGGSERTQGGPQFYQDAGGPKYRVGPKDNLTAISGRYLGDESRWDEIYQLNRDLLRDANMLPVGTVLLLPPGATQQPMAEEPRAFR